jgi:replicative DNA helicase
MTENTEHTLTAYLGPEFQQRLIWQLLVEPEFAEKILPDLAIEYFDDPNLKRLFIIILEYFKEYDKVPNLQNKSIHQAIHEFKAPNNTIEEESLFGVIKRIELWNERIVNKQMLYDGDAIQKSAHFFVKQQEYRKISEHIQTKVKDGGIRSKYTVAAIEEKFQKIALIGEEDDDCESVTEGIEKALRKEFRETIPTGIGAIDELTDGGLGKGEMGIILAPSGVGKTTALTIIANTAYDCEKNVAHIVFEDTKDQIKRKHYTIWADSALSRLSEDEEHDRVLNIAIEKTKSMEGKGRLLVKRFSQEDTTIRDIRNWMISYEKKWGFKFDILVLDYLDCVESHKKSPDRNEAELAVVKGFEALAGDFNIPAWTAIQSNRSGIGAEYVEAQQTGGSIKRMQKAHFFMSIAKTPAQQDANFANIRIIKARFAKDGQMFEDCIFNNDTMKIIIDDPRYRGTKNYKRLKHHDSEDIDKLEKKADGLSQVHVAISNKMTKEDEIISKLNSDSISGGTEAQRINDMLHKNKQPEDNSDIQPEINFHPEVENIHISTSRTDLSHDEIKQVADIVNEVMEESQGTNEDVLELDGEVTDAPSDAVNDGVSDAVKDETLLDFSGDTTTETVGETSEIPVPEEKGLTYGEDYVDAFEGERQLVTKSVTEETPPTPEEQLQALTEDTDEIMKLIEETDLNAPDESQKEFKNSLVKKRDYQNVKPEK